ncbi:TIGR00297 family protein [Clostridiales bacterium oral taxon 876 str. F0540]|nr:TIGR00297 family protein [Clostridiales bacterium oral taxon 876 str. F0540]
MNEFITGLLFSLIIAFAAYKKNSLNLSGACGAVLLGTFIYFFGGLYLSLIMISFFVSSSIFTKVKEGYKDSLQDINEKNGARDYIQVAANGGLGLLFAFLYYRTKNPVFLVAYSTAFASSTADTWASELGVLSKSKPISILSFKQVERGMSGAISLIGTLSALFGAILIAFVYALGYIFIFGFSEELIKYVIVITLAGFIGSLVDSIIGAAFQAKYECICCGKLTEKKFHHGKNTMHISGIWWVNNDIVNFVSGFIACMISIILYYIG